MKKLKGEGLAPELLTLDVASVESIAAAKDSVEKKYGRLDVLINNAAVLFRVCVVTSIVMRTQVCARHHVMCLTMTHFTYTHTHTHTHTLKDGFRYDSVRESQTNHRNQLLWSPQSHQYLFSTSST